MPLLSPEWDTAGLLRLIWECWNDVFAKTLGRTERSIVSELMEIRNKWAHQKPFSTDDACRAPDSTHRLPNAVGAGKETDELDQQKSELMRVRFDEQARHKRRKTQPTLGLESGGMAGLKPWRKMVTPHPDVASGRYQQAEFAAEQTRHRRPPTRGRTAAAVAGGTRNDLPNRRRYQRRSGPLAGDRQWHASRGLSANDVFRKCEGGHNPDQPRCGQHRE